MPGKKKNRRGQAPAQEEDPKDAELARLRKQNDDLAKQLSELLAEMKELRKSLQPPGKGGQSTAAGDQAAGKGAAGKGPAPQQQQ